jgi:uncharacterized protein GlcG (DUF336 family)
MSGSQKRPRLALNLPDEDAARALADALAEQLAAMKGKRVTVKVTDQDGNEVCAPTAEIVRH